MYVDWIVNTALPIETLEKALPENKELLNIMRLNKANRIYIQIIILYNSFASSIFIDHNFIRTFINTALFIKILKKAFLKIKNF